MKTLITVIIIIILVVLGAYFFIPGFSEVFNNQSEEPDKTEVISEEENGEENEEEIVDETQTLIGQSVEGNDITAYHFGEGDTEVLLVGGIHGGYSWNTALMAYEAMDYFEENSEEIPENVKLTIVPVLNPDGLERVTGSSGRFNVSQVSEDTVAGRFNANGVDLNRNFDCRWEEEGVWQSQTVSGGSSIFSEPESQAIRSYIESNNPSAVVVYYSAAGGVFASNCLNGVLNETLEITNLYAVASGYPAYEEFNFYEITGDMVNWLAKENIPGISVLLTNHNDVEWNKNRQGIEALLQYYAN